MKTLTFIITLLAFTNTIAQTLEPISTPELAIETSNFVTQTIVSPLDEEIKEMQPISDLSLNENVVSGINKFIQYQVLLLQNNNLAQQAVNNDIVVKGMFKSKQYITFLNNTPVNKNNIYGKGIYIAPTMEIGSGDQNTTEATNSRTNFVNSTLDLGYEVKTINFNMDLFAGAGLAYNTDFITSTNLLIIQTGVIFKL